MPAKSNRSDARQFLIALSLDSAHVFMYHSPRIVEETGQLENSQIYGDNKCERPQCHKP